MGSVLGSFGAPQGNIWSVAPFIPEGDQEEPKISILPYWNFFNGKPFQFFSWWIIDPKEPFWCDWSNFEDFDSLFHTDPPSLLFLAAGTTDKKFGQWLTTTNSMNRYQKYLPHYTQLTRLLSYIILFNKRLFHIRPGLAI